jgi:hypothetical protein
MGTASKMHRSENGILNGGGYKESPSLEECNSFAQQLNQRMADPARRIAIDEALELHQPGFPKVLRSRKSPLEAGSH